MIFHIARSVDILGFKRPALKFVKDGAIRFLHHIGQHRQAAAMRHADDNLFDPERAAAFDDLLKRRNKAFAAIKSKALGAHVFDMKEFFKAFSLDHLI